MRFVDRRTTRRVGGEVSLVESAATLAKLSLLARPTVELDVVDGAPEAPPQLVLLSLGHVLLLPQLALLLDVLQTLGRRLVSPTLQHLLRRLKKRGDRDRTKINTDTRDSMLAVFYTRSRHQHSV